MKSIFCLVNLPEENYSATSTFSEFIHKHSTDSLSANRPVIRMICDDYEVIFADKQYTYSRKGNRWDVHEEHDVDIWSYDTHGTAPYELDRNTSSVNFIIRTINATIRFPAPSSFQYSSPGALLHSTFEFEEHFSKLAKHNSERIIKLYEVTDINQTFLESLAKDIVQLFPIMTNKATKKSSQGPIKALVNFFKKEKPHESDNENDNEDSATKKNAAIEFSKSLWGSGMEPLKNTLYYALGNEQLLKKFISNKNYDQLQKVEYLNLHPITVALLFQLPSSAIIFLSKFDILPTDSQEISFIFNTCLNKDGNTEIMDILMKKMDKSQVHELVLSEHEIVTSKAFLSNKKVFQWAVSLGFDVLKHYNRFQTPTSLLGTAASHGAFDAAEYILSQHPSDKDIAQSVTSASGSSDFQLKCLDAITDSTLKREAAESLLVQAAGNEKPALVRTLLKKYLGGKTQSKDALYSCCGANHKFNKDIADMLLDAGATINGISLLPCTLDRWYTNTQAVKWLLEHGADPNERESRWNSNLTPLHRACEANLEVVKLLVKYGANTNTRVNGKTPKQHAANAEITDFLNGITYPFEGIPSLLDSCLIIVRKNMTSHAIQKSHLPQDLKDLLQSNKFQGVSQASWGNNLNSSTKKLLGWIDYITDSAKRDIFMGLADGIKIEGTCVIFPSSQELGVGADKTKIVVQWESKDSNNSYRWSKWCFNLRPFHKHSVNKKITPSDLEADKEFSSPVSNGTALCTFGYIGANYHTWNERFSCTGLKNWSPVLKKLGLDKNDYYPFAVLLVAVWWWGKHPGQLPTKNSDIVGHEFFDECKNNVPEWFQQTLQAWI